MQNLKQNFTLKARFHFMSSPLLYYIWLIFWGKGVPSFECSGKPAVKPQEVTASFPQ